MKISEKWLSLFQGIMYIGSKFWGSTYSHGEFIFINCCFLRFKHSYRFPNICCNKEHYNNRNTSERDLTKSNFLSKLVFKVNRILLIKELQRTWRVYLEQIKNFGSFQLNKSSHLKKSIYYWKNSNLVFNYFLWKISC